MQILKLAKVENGKYGSAVKSNLEKTSLVLNVFTDINTFEQLVLQRLANKDTTLSIGVLHTPFEVAKDIVRLINEGKTDILYVTGSTSASLAVFGIDETKVGNWFLNVFAEVSKKKKISVIISDGMSGVGIAVIAASIKASIDVEGFTTEPAAEVEEKATKLAKLLIE